MTTRRLRMGGRRNSGERLRRAAVAAALVGMALGTALPAAAAGKAPGKASSAAGRSPGEAPILEGRLRPGAVMGVGPEWRKGFEDYQPDPASLERLRSLSRQLRGDLQVDVVIGTWCGDSRREVPRFIKIQRTLGKDRLPATIWGVDRTKTSPAESVQGREIERVPTFIVKHKGREIGRIVETPEVSVEADLAEILSRAGKESG